MTPKEALPNLIDRPIYLEKLRALRDPELVKVLVGVRRCGKSSLLRLFERWLREDGVEASRIITIDFENPDADAFRDPSAFRDFLAQALPEDGEGYLFVDEVQELGEWARTINGVRAKYPGLDIYVTGSNQRLFAGEHLTYLAGRYVKVDVYPLSFAEFLEFAGDRMPMHGTIAELIQKWPRFIDVPQNLTMEQVSDFLTIEGEYNDYVSTGAFPAVALSPNPLLAGALLDGLYDSVFQRDILLRGGARNEEAFRRVARYLLSNIGNPTSPVGIAKALAAGGHRVAPNTVDRYLGLLEKAYLVYRCERYDLRGKEVLKTNGKYYAVDQGLRRRVIGAADRDRGHVTENLVYLELRRRGYEVFCGSLPGAEIDFVVNQPNALSSVAAPTATTVYVQVCETLADPTTLDRELRPFSKLKDRYPCVLITKDAQLQALGDGVRHMNLYEFLLGAQLS